MNCKDCDYIYERLKQQEETIAQLVEIIAATNRRLTELDQRQHGFEHHIIRESPSLFTPST
ncbi:hypothetical protein SAMN04487936_102234 [Halobacillus dabanensis]|uniref:Uncharacterized protein n=1 Tax=Halobacillus dabanensis TaxID=240302 RepID=A0A1I3RGG6_HALDA|nr:hypothetical protein [Halobacillus dabanensis]SFJ45368.1 hypothetical protein SAMN04487936_102234 [Halobacillus dabanensis]